MAEGKPVRSRVALLLAAILLVLVVVLDALLVRPTNSTTTDFNRLKQTPGFLDAKVRKATRP